MHTTRALLDAEALLYMCTGLLAVVVPQAFVRMLTTGANAGAVHVIVPWLGALAVGMAVSQRGINAMGDVRALRVMLHGRLVTDLLISLTALFYARGFGEAPNVVLTLAMSVALIFSAVRFHALVLISDAEEGLGGIATDP